MLSGRMMEMPLTISSVIDYAADVRSDTEVVSQCVEGGIHRYNYAAAHQRTCQLAHALKNMGIKEGDRVATLAWNGHRHFELYFAISGIGSVCHTINPRLFADQIVYIINHANDRVLFLDINFIPIITPLIDRLPKDLKFVALCDRKNMPDCEIPDLVCFEDLLAGQSNSFSWPTLDERSASALCYTSGTTGNPKGVLFSHRSTLLHTYGMLVFAADVGLNSSAVVLPVVPFFHANGWGLPFATPLVGAKFVLPGPGLDGQSLFELMDAEGVTSAWGVPTIWLGLLAEMRKNGKKPDGFQYMLVGGSAVPRSMIAEFEIDFGVRVVHGWGMTETSPIGSTTTFGPAMRALPLEQQIDLKVSQGRRMYTVDIRIVDDEGGLLPNDGEAFGELQVRGHAVMNGYFDDKEASVAALTDDGWLRTGDVAKIDQDGFVSLVDRTKDVIKSGGEWISSIDLENAAQGHAAIKECAVIAAIHPKWAERPLLIVVLEDDKEITPDEIKEYLAGKVAKWWLPDDVLFIDELPHTATGKISKLTLRKLFADHVLSTA
ncbi:long-chain fatty acid--CoA ligase [Alphaproteobacteria bacterium]|nr:long-chain fatty acid--CoA ligase [Alphaproteobacteria bacterium]|tara:strand:+ start:83 stop:1723 length:1641 start_codon:yes stop_codon:yes gene_type:complete